MVKNIFTNLYVLSCTICYWTQTRQT